MGAVYRFESASARVAFLVVLGACGAARCGTDAGREAAADVRVDTAAPETCAPGVTAACECATGSGAKVCGEDGRFGECACHFSNVRFRPDVIVFQPDDLTAFVRGPAEITSPDGTQSIRTTAALFPREGNDALAPLRPGDRVIVLGAPGLIGLVVSSQVVDDEIRVDVIDLPLTAVFDELDVHIAERGGLAPGKGDLPGARGASGSNKEMRLSADIIVNELNFDIGAPDFDIGIRIRNPVLTGAECIYEILTACETECSGYWPWEWECETVCDNPDCEQPLPVLEHFELAVDTDVEFDVDVTGVVGGTAAWSYEKSLVPEKRWLVGFFYGVPVYATFEVAIGCQLYGTGGAAIELRYEFDAPLTVGAEYDGSWSNLSNATFDDDWDIEAAPTAEVGLKCYLAPKFGLAIANLAGPYVQVEVGPSASATFTYVGWVQKELAVKGVIAVILGGEIELLGVKLANISVELWSKAWPLWSCEDACDVSLAACTGASDYNRCDALGNVLCSDWVAETCATDTWCRLGDDEEEKRYACTPCGDGAIEYTEICDTQHKGCTDGCSTGFARCGATCDAWEECIVSAAVCGDGIPQGCEVCDGAKALCRSPDRCYLGHRSCASDCRSFEAACDVAGQRCGNGVAEGCEACDGGARACTSPDGCYAGLLPCAADCGGYAALCDIGAQRCGDGTVEGCEACDGGSLACFAAGYPGRRACRGDCTGYGDCATGGQVCGNGVLEGGELCDGTSVDCVSAWTAYRGRATCTADCRSRGVCTPTERCGDGLVNGRETCDDGTDNGAPLSCNASCTGTTAPDCGNGVGEPGEECDEGALNAVGEGRCLPDCTRQSCGDSRTNGSEACDDGGHAGGDGCVGDCSKREVCGDGVSDDGEDCDDGLDNGTPNHCATDCSRMTPAVCGNLVAEEGEACDDGEGEGEGRCLDDCSRLQTCGDGAAQGTEVCDDANTGSDDGCRADCLAIESCGDTVVQGGLGEACDDGEGGTCFDDCRGENVCGDGTPFADEACDDGLGASLSIAGSFDFNDPVQYWIKTHYADEVHAEGDLLYVLDTTKAGVLVLDGAAGWDAPTQVQWRALAGIRDMHFRGDRAYLLTTSAVRVANVLADGRLELDSAWTMATARSDFENVFVHGDRVLAIRGTYAPTVTGDSVVLLVPNGTRFEEASTYTHASDVINDVAAIGNTVVLGTGTGIQILDMSTGELRLVGTFEEGNSGGQVGVVGDRLLFVHREATGCSLHLASVAGTALTSIEDVGVGCSSVFAAAGRYVFVTSSGALRVYDTGADTFALVAESDPSGEPSGLGYSRGRLFRARREWGVIVYGGPGPGSCVDDCTRAQSCGDGIVDGTEACDPPDGLLCPADCEAGDARTGG